MDSFVSLNGAVGTLNPLPVCASFSLSDSYGFRTHRQLLMQAQFLIRHIECILLIWAVLYIYTARRLTYFPHGPHTACEGLGRTLGKMNSWMFARCQNLKKFEKNGWENFLSFKKILKRCGKYHVYSMGWIMFLFLFF